MFAQTRPAGRPARWLARLSLIPVGLFLLWLGGLTQFTSGLTDAVDEPDRPTDGVVVLTGSPGRIGVAVDLMRRGLGQRLLISGVRQGTDKATLGRALGVPADMLACCIDLGEAGDTVANAEESAVWAKVHGYGSLRVVTASFHMPRSLIEFRRRMPEIALVAHPVPHKDVRIDTWWRWPGTARLLVGEYNKYLVSLVRARLAGGGGDLEAGS